jgi:phosphoribosylaminoimidazole-succinocarboxamide synthase
LRFTGGRRGGARRAGDPESFDKEYVRRWLVEQGFRGDGPIPVIPDEVKIEAVLRYVEAVEQITGQPFVPSLDDPNERMRRNLKAEFGATRID